MKNTKAFLRKNKGITLVALVVTIVILLILAGVSLNLVLGENGIVRRANEARSKTRIASDEEAVQMAVFGIMLDGDLTAQKLEDELNKTRNGEFTISEADGVITVSFNGGKSFEVDKTTGAVALVGPSITVTDLAVVESSSGTGTAIEGARSVSDLTKKLYIRFKASINDGEITSVTSTSGTVEKKGEYYVMEISENGTYTFALAGTEDASKTQSITVNQYDNLQGLAIGSEVTYEPAGTYNWQAKYASGNLSIVDEDEDGKIDGDVELDSRASGAYRITSWKVLSLDDGNGNILLVPNTLPSGKVRLQGAQGYNNGVKLLDDACEALYSDSSKGITARSIDMEDIEPMLDSTKLTAEQAKFTNANTSYSHLNDNNQVKTAYSKSNSYYPLIYELENNSVIDEAQPVTNGLGLSDTLKNSSGNTIFIERDGTGAVSEKQSTETAIPGKVQATISIQPYQTYYQWSSALTTAANYNSRYTDTEKTALASMFNKTFWVASRCINTDSSSCYFNVRDVNRGTLNYSNVFHSSRNPGGPSRALFPVVSLAASHIGKSGSNFVVQ